jgi:hypothetical protein
LEFQPVSWKYIYNYRVAAVVAADNVSDNIAFRAGVNAQAVNTNVFGGGTY